MLISQYDAENEHYLATWSGKFNHQAHHSSLNSPHMLPPIGPEGKYLPSTRHGLVPIGHVQATQPPVHDDSETEFKTGPTPGPTLGTVPEPISRQKMSGQYPGNGHMPHGQSVHIQPKKGGAHGPGQSYLREVQNAESPPKSSDRKRKSHDLANHDTGSREAKTGKAMSNPEPEPNSTEVVRVNVIRSHNFGH